MSDFVLVFCTINDFEKAREISRKLLEEKLIACSNIIPKVTSIYQWKGDICEETEYLMLMKTKYAVFDVLKVRITELHPYEVPEVLAIDIKEGIEDYLNWVEQSVI